ncbi:MAG: PASTA domain-containing protein [Thermodesulfovibrionales bacterium]|nr:PASTA domain-containing protein [Thermodesulfovibrionales bacterium]
MNNEERPNIFPEDRPGKIHVYREPSGSRCRGIMLYLSAFLAISLISGYITFKLFETGNLVGVPDLKGKSLYEAACLLKETGLDMAVERTEYDQHVPEGRVISQDIPAGSSVKEKTGIRVLVSNGPAALSVPHATGKTLEEAEGIFQKSGLEISSVIYVHSDTVEKDRVIAQRPLPEDKAEEPATLIVSSGPYDVIYYCPEFKGMQAEKAVDLARELGLNTVISGEGERVNSQMPEAGEIISAGGTVHLQL